MRHRQASAPLIPDSPASRAFQVGAACQDSPPPAPRLDRFGQDIQQLGWILCHAGHAVLAILRESSSALRPPARFGTGPRASRASNQREIPRRRHHKKSRPKGGESEVSGGRGREEFERQRRYR